MKAHGERAPIALEIGRKERENFWGESEISLDQERSWTILAAVAKRSVFGSADGFQPTEHGALHGAGDKAGWRAEAADENDAVYKQVGARQDGGRWHL